ncbi:MAG: hypothetical protein M3008_02945 [Chloroflexota bacterium]|nr:hypothetical protein [Chloroflexota bacterium]
MALPGGRLILRAARYSTHAKRNVAKRRMADDLDRPAPVPLDPLLARPGIALIRPDMLQTRELDSNPVQDEGTAARSCASAACTVARKTSPSTSTKRCHLRPESFFAPS